MIEVATGEALIQGLNALNAGLSGQTMTGAYDALMTDSFDTNDGPPIGYGKFTGLKPAITGDTSQSIAESTEPVAVDAWNDYVENEVTQVSPITGGIVEGSNVSTFVYSLLEENPGTADAAVKAVAPVAVPVQAAVVGICQALGISMNAVELEAELRDTLINTCINTAGVVYDAAADAITAWKDEWGRILFPKKLVNNVALTLSDLGIGGTSGYKGDSWSDQYITGVVETANGVEYTSVMSQYNPPRQKRVVITFDLPIVRTNDHNYVCFSRTQTAVHSVTVETPLNYSGSPTTTERTVQVNIARTVNGQNFYYNNVYTGSISGGTDRVEPSLPTYVGSLTSIQKVDACGYVVLFGTQVGSYPEGTEESQANKYTPSTIPSAGNLATSYDPDTSDLIFEEVVPVQLTEDPYDSIGSTADPTGPTDEDNPGVVNPPIPLPVPDTNVSNPDVPLTNPTVVDSTLVEALVNELAETLDPQPAQSSGIIPIPPMPGLIDPITGASSYPTIVPASGSGLIHVYNPTPAEFVSFGNWLWVTYADATIDKIWNNPFDGIISAHELYATPATEGSDNIRSGFLVCPTTAALVRQRYTEIDCGTIIVPEFYGNYLDYSPYSQAYIYLPFIGINEISIDDIVGHAVNVRYRVDAYNGSCIAMIFVAKDGYQNLCYQFAGNCAVEVPLAGGSQAAIKAGVMQAEAYARSAMIQAAGNVFGGIGSALMGNYGGILSAIGGIASNYGNAQAGMEAARVANKSSVQHSGQFGASHGAMGEKIPFIIIRNPIQVKVVNYNEEYGFPAHKRVIVGGCRGYLRVREVNVISAHATNEEKMAIELALKNGVYVS